MSFSASPIAGFRFYLDDEELLGADYDEGADVLYLWRGASPVEAISLATDEGPVIRLNPQSGDVVGFTIMDWSALWRDKKRIDIYLPSLGRTQDEPDAEEPARHSLLALAG